MLKNYLITSLTSCENLKLIKARVFNPDLALLFIPLCVRLSVRISLFLGAVFPVRAGGSVSPLAPIRRVVIFAARVSEV